MGANHVIKAKVTKEEKIKAEKIAKDAGFTMTDYIKLLIFNSKVEKIGRASCRERV